MKPLWSVVLIARNESKTLPRLVKSLGEFQTRGGEIILLDTGSTDDTAEVGRKLGCSVHEVGTKFITVINATLAQKINARFVTNKEPDLVKEGDKLFDYASARNFAATLSSNDMISMPDCDEIFTALDIDKINESITAGIEQLEYNFVFEHDEFGREVVKFMHCKFYNRTKQKWVGIVHEVLQGEAVRKFFQEDVIKLEHYRNVETNRSGYLVGLALDCYLNPNNDRNSHYLARDLFWSFRTHSAIKEFKRHIAMNKWPAERAQSMVYIGDAMGRLNQPEEQIQWYSRAFYTDPNRREALIKMSCFYKHYNKPKPTAAYAAAALEIPWEPFYANDMNQYAQLPHQLMYWAKGWLADIKGAQQHWLKAYSFLPQDKETLRDYSYYFPKPKVSIVIPTLGREDKLLNLLELIKREARYDNYEIVVERDAFDGKELNLGKAEENSTTFARNINSKVNFTFVKCGDGEKACMNGDEGATCDGQTYSPELAAKLKDAYEIIKTVPNAIVVNFEDQVQFNLLLHRRGNHIPSVRNFYKSIRDSQRIKIFVGPEKLIKVNPFLKTNHFIVVPEKDAFFDYEGILNQCVDKLTDDCIFVFSAGPLAKVLIGDLLKIKTDITLIDAGSAFDPIFLGQTRTEQLDKDILNLYYSDFFDENAPTQRRGVPRTLQKGVERSTGDLVMFLGNDCIPRPNFLLNAVIAMVTNFPELDGLVGLNDGYWHGEFATHWLASKKLLPMLDGEFFHSGYNHCGCDNELTERCRNAGKYFWSKESEVYHDHPIQSGFNHQLTDEVYKIAYDKDRVNDDRRLLRSRAEKYGFKVIEAYERPKG